VPLTPEDNARLTERSRRNGRLSRGPTSIEGRKRSSLSALFGGHAAKTFPLPFEADAAEKRLQEWHAGYRSENPAAVHLTNECARATILADRCHSYRGLQLAEHARKVRRNWNRRRRRRVQLSPVCASSVETL
jgi:hypothetical protein